MRLAQPGLPEQPVIGNEERLPRQSLRYASEFVLRASLLPTARNPFFVAQSSVQVAPAQADSRLCSWPALFLQTHSDVRYVRRSSARTDRLSTDPSNSSPSTAEDSSAASRLLKEYLTKQPALHLKYSARSEDWTSA